MFHPEFVCSSVCLYVCTRHSGIMFYYNESDNTERRPILSNWDGVRSRKCRHTQRERERERELDGACSVMVVFTGFSGDHCQVNIDDCRNNRCANHATCVDAVQSYHCSCPPQWQGTAASSSLSLSLSLCTISPHPLFSLFPQSCHRQVDNAG